MNERYFHRVYQQTLTRFWVNNPTASDLELALGAGAINCTTNPAYCSKLIQREPDYIHGIIDEVISQTQDDREAARRICDIVSLRVLKRFAPLHEASGGKEGFVTIQGDPREDDNAEAIVQDALRHSKLAKNFMAKIPVTVAGAEAMEQLIELGVPVCATEVFSLAQAVYIYDVYRRAKEKFGKEPPFFLTHITGIFDQYLAQYVKDKGIDIAPDVLAQAGCAVGRKQYHLLSQRGHKVTMLGGGARGIQHFTEFVGGDMHITINWSTAEELIEEDLPVTSRIDVETPQAALTELCEKLPDFRKAFSEDGLSPEQFENFGPLVLFRNMFLDGYEKLLSEIRIRRKQPSQAVAIFPKPFEGQVVMVTGGSVGIGAAIVEQFVSLGARVGCCYRSNAAAAQSLADKLNRQAKVILPVQVDVGDEDQVKSAVDSIAKHFGQPISILINNAGDILHLASVESLTQEQWNRVMAVNLTGTFLCAKHCIAGMKAKNTGRIINISSLAARAGGGVGSVAYAVSKGAVETFTRGLAKELAPFNITVNAVAPGVVDTAIIQRYNVTGNLGQIKQRTPLGRLGTPDEVAGAVTFLASKKASYITGETIAVNGGLRMD